MDILLLHGAIGASDQLQPLADQLGRHFNVHLVDFSGHGGRPFATEEFSMHLFAQDVLWYMEQEGLENASVFGFSMGGFVGMYLARHYPGKVSKLITLGTKWHWDETVAAREKQMLDPDKISEKLPAFAETLRLRHEPNNWKEVLKQTADMMTALGRDNALKQEDLAAIEIPVLLMLGDRDKMVNLDETLSVYKTLPNAQMTVLPGTQHPIEQLDTELAGFIAAHFLSSEL